jgi:gamma-glutamylcyclotransferase (GGCT)/AIG2-like uncharacterized protein YtfP
VVISGGGSGAAGVSTRVFAYGTLEIPGVMRAVTGRSFPSRGAVLAGFARFMIRNQAYPGIVPSHGEETPGRLYEGIDRCSLERLDRFEGTLYDRCTVRVRTEDGMGVSAVTYVVRTDRRGTVGTEPWVRSRFVARHLRDFLDSSRRS